MSGYADTVPEQAAETDTTVELVMTEDIYEQLTTLYPPDNRPAAQRESLRVFHGPIPYEYGLWIGDDSHAGLVVYTDQGINGLIINESDAAVEWATEQYEQVRERATPVTEQGAYDTTR
ncbi:hypothetical protein ACFQH2_10055 [Natronoarchaeum sp. GCM10025703]|uniref:transcriptional regulator FilR1 domain-containing protein n=1 Tax=Natronoarchaeum sp. GCM10025703 TaxID=3252685 RepID=UPI003618DDFB